MHQSFFVQNYQHELLINSLTNVFGKFDLTMLSLIEPQLEWIELSGGEILFHQNDPDDSLYFVISGRLRAFITTPDHEYVTIGEIVRGETVGEMALFTGEPRGASIVAIRDSVLVKLSKPIFEEVIKAYPLISMNVTKIIINRLRLSQSPKKNIQKPVNICLFGVSTDTLLSDFATQLLPYLQKKGNTLLLSSEIVNQIHQTEHLAQANKNDTILYRKLSRWLDEQEYQHDLLVYLCDPNDTEWTSRCIRNADEIYLLASASESPEPSILEKKLFDNNHRIGAFTNLILLHPENTIIPSNTEVWLKPRNIKRHFHVRLHTVPELQRLARIISGTAIGLVLAGGGAKGFAHLGIYQALKEYGIAIDFVGGTSVGAMMAALIALGVNPEKAKDNARQGAIDNPTKDYTLLPFVSLIQGNRIEKMIRESIRKSVGKDVMIEDTWLTFYAVSSNYSKAREELHTRGPLAKYLRASSSIPGAFPPVVDGEHFLVDGGTFNNFPTDIMNKMGVAKIIGVDLNIDKPRKLTIDRMPSGWEILKDKLNSKENRKYRVPSLMSIILNSTVLYSNARQNETKKYTDLYFNPDLKRFSILNWKAFDEIYHIGYQHAKEVLSNMTEEELQYFRE
ncbi:patatin-like phospholipase family protein [Flectobacillus major]|uniref:patatin-like phospholipase family protein n=1 Tax=Flectobacillus major TaxID=103 RepID=UPI00040BCCBC|nr:patatin-like phospholipase family protein [Flectobacillus major]